MKKLLLVLLFVTPLLLAGQTKYFSLYTTYEYEGGLKQWHNDYKKFLPGLGTELYLKNGFKFSIGASHDYTETFSAYSNNNISYTYTTYSSHSLQLPVTIGYSIFKKSLSPYQAFVTTGYIYERVLATNQSTTYTNPATTGTEQKTTHNYTHHWFTGGIDIRRIFAGKYLLGMSAYFAQQESSLFGTRGRLGVKAGILL